MTLITGATDTVRRLLARPARTYATTSARDHRAAFTAGGSR
ncbi:MULTISPECIES: hypothetical protein [Streptomyces]|uniref:Uncharacterized protein n=1 Tax=Streptomyces sp. NBC_00093 TaxID=2975649 RepID=A0AAU2A326_9ACTN